MHHGRMAIPLAIALCLLALCQGACDKDDHPVIAPPPPEPSPLAEMTITMGFGTAADSLTGVGLTIGYDRNYQGAFLGGFDLIERRRGDVVIIDRRSSATFDSFATRMTNGAEDTVFARLRVNARNGGGMTMTTSAPESTSLTGRIGTTGPDLADTTISRAEVTFEQLHVLVPGMDLGHDGHWVDVYAVVVIRLY